VEDADFVLSAMGSSKPVMTACVRICPELQAIKSLKRFIFVSCSAGDSAMQAQGVRAPLRHHSGDAQEMSKTSPGPKTSSGSAACRM